jgi:hypothetical protein
VHGGAEEFQLAAGGAQAGFGFAVHRHADHITILVDAFFLVNLEIGNWRLEIACGSSL